MSHLSFCHSVILCFCHLLETLTLLITFEQWMLELWYFTCVFVVIRPFLPFDLDLGVWPIVKNLNLANNFWIASARALIFHKSIPCDKNFPWISLFFYPVTLTLEFDPFYENFYLANIVWTVNARALIFHMSIPWDKIFPWVPLIFTLWHWPWNCIGPIFKKNFNLAKNFWTMSARVLIFHLSIPCDKTFPWVPLFLPCYLGLGVWPIFKFYPC